MVKLICNKCKRIVDIPLNKYRNDATCSVCQGYFQELNQNQRQPQNFNLSNQFNQIANSIPNIPHIVIGKQGVSTNKPNYPNQTQYNPNLNTQNINLPYSNRQMPNYETIRENKYKKIKDYAMYFLVGIVIIVAAGSIIMSFLS
jgi:hypothetical protein